MQDSSNYDTEMALPMEADRLLPHRRPMLLVDRLVQFGERGGMTETRLAGDSVFVDAKGRLETVVAVELIAQSYAAVKGYLDRLENVAVRRGFLVGIQNLEITGTISSGGIILTEINILGGFAGFSVARGTIVCGGRCVATGKIKVWLEE